MPRNPRLTPQIAGANVLEIPPLPPHLQKLAETEYPRFSDAEMKRRRAAIEGLLQEAGCDHLVFCGANRFGSVVQWLTGWPVTAEAVGVFTPDTRDALFVQFVNHVELASLIAREADVAWGGPSSIESAIGVLTKCKAQRNRIAFIGPLSLAQHAAISKSFGAPKDLNKAYITLRQVKSTEELDWLRIGAYFADLGMAALRNNLTPGISEIELGARIEAAYAPLGGGHAIHYVGVTSMHTPEVPVPRQFASRRRVQTGDAVSAEISASFWEHPGQVLRSFTVGEGPTPLYRDLHAAADAAFDAICKILKAGALPQQVIDDSRVIEDSGFTIIDDLLHGYGGGYLPPILGSTSRPAGPIPQEPFRAGQTVVVQPNVVTRDGKAGVQMGELLLITERGLERMHRYPRGYQTV
jgi:Xaa-Pro aminopeptidase